jgi:hypothetical protein
LMTSSTHFSYERKEYIHTHAVSTYKHKQTLI